MIEFTPAAQFLLDILFLLAVATWVAYTPKPPYKGNGRYEPTTVERTMRKCSYPAYCYQLEVAGPPQQYSVPSIQRAWLGGVCEVDITKLTHIGDAIEADFIYRGHELRARVNGYGCNEERMLKVLAMNIEHIKQRAFRSKV